LRGKATNIASRGSRAKSIPGLRKVTGTPCSVTGIAQKL
jgi:hypothetical protein